MQIIRKSAFARAGLAGNPSDGYFGKTVSFAFQEFYARVILYEWENIEVLPSQQDHSLFNSVDDLVRDVRLHGYYGGIRLVKATIKRFVEFCQEKTAMGDGSYALHDRRFSVRYETNIPRQVGLAGSSAIIIATLKALMEFYGVQIPLRVQPSLALDVERSELGIKGGLQDRVVQVFNGLVYMDFSRGATERISGLDCGEYEPLDTNDLPPLYIAYSEEASEPTEVLHNPLRSKYDSGDPDVVNAMKRFASYAVDAREALQNSDKKRLATTIDKNFDTRQSICQLHADHRKMIHTARSVGASAKYAGSGGAIVGTYEGEEMFEKLQQKLESLPRINCRVFKPTIAR